MNKMVELKPCPCGKTPTKLCVDGDYNQSKWAWVSGDCCSDWSLEFRTGYNTYKSDECLALATERWNEAARAKSYGV